MNNTAPANQSAIETATAALRAARKAKDAAYCAVFVSLERSEARNLAIAAYNAAEAAVTAADAAYDTARRNA
jgi:hypothetical protein